MKVDLLSKLAFVDVETTGTNATSDRVIDIGIIRVEEGKVVSEYQTLVNPLSHVSDYILSMTRITSEMLYRAPVFEEIKSDVLKQLTGATFVAHNAQFDYAFIKNEFARLETKFSAKVLCTVKLSRALFPGFRKHNLDAIIERFNIDVGQRHRAFPDAKALYFFLQKVGENNDQTVIQKAVKGVTARPSLPPAIDPKMVKNIPHTPGVYIFYDKDGTVLYIGKSVNLKDRIMNHLSSFHNNGLDLKLSSLTTDIEIIRKAGDLSASLLEAELIKKIQPVFNKRLREAREMIALVKVKNGEFDKLKLERIKTPIDGADYNKILTVYPSFRRAKSEVYGMVKEVKLCPLVLGLEKGKGPCFNYQIDKCDGACVDKVSPLRHNLRLIEAFGERLIPRWPFDGEITVTEKSDNLTEMIHVNNWIHTGTTSIEGAGLPIFERKIKGIYIDTVKILKRFLKKRDYLKSISIPDSSGLRPDQYAGGA